MIQLTERKYFELKEGTLAYEIDALDKSPLSTERKREEYTNAFNAWGKKNELVQRVINGTASFAAEYDTTLKGIESWSNIFLGHSLPEGFAERIESLEQCLGPVVERSWTTGLGYKAPLSESIGGRFQGMVGPMTALGGPFAVGYGIAKVTDKEEKKFSRRSLLKGTALFAGGMGASIGLGSGMDTEGKLQLLRNRAQYLDRAYLETFIQQELPSFSSEEKASMLEVIGISVLLSATAVGLLLLGLNYGKSVKSGAEEKK